MPLLAELPSCDVCYERAVLAEEALLPGGTSCRWVPAPS
eukprot:CAMPEP_0195047124 /NCGR_PEP_ID=MMETSP0347-20130606/32946_1 /TAXON_ID=2932 /ORGANISM="Alexandrium fundyense, Strain CCMP1719" /LENGTH=38 /DNA_ID= /DNA_START= /DNA_END= /DNA_ORIENTATION=